MQACFWVESQPLHRSHPCPRFLGNPCMDLYSESTSWIWGASLIVATTTFHAIGVVSMALAMIGIRLRLEERHLGLRYVMPAVIGVVAVVGLVLTVLHGIEATVWA